MDTKQDFLNGLRRALTGKIKQEVLEEHIRYYEDYITAETQIRGSERDVLQMLGDPKLIAMSICAADAAGGSAGACNSSDGMEREGASYNGRKKHGNHGAENENTGDDKNKGPFLLRHPGLLIALVIAVLLIIFLVVIAIAFSLLKLLWPVIVVIIVVILVVRLIAYLRER